MRTAFILYIGTFLIAFVFPLSSQSPFRSDLQTNPKPWTEKGFENDPNEFQFAIVTDRTGGHRKGVFGKAVAQLNLLQPEFVMCVGDLIEGYTKDQMEIESQWDEFNTILNALQMRFFYLPGNHDISNEVMRRDWLNRYGKSYYHFIYKDVLFLAFDTNDGDGVQFSDEQVEYFKTVIQENQEVRWTLVFMHHPIWSYRSFNRFGEIESLLSNRPYTVFAGHTHHYFFEERNDRNYYVLSTTGGGNRLRGPRFGEMDHVVWMTMTSDGPKMINLQLDGLLNHDISNEQTRLMARSLMEASSMDYNLLSSTPSATSFEAGKLYFNLSNTANDTLFLDARFYHNHQLDVDPNSLSMAIAPGHTEAIEMEVEAFQVGDTATIEVLFLDWVLSYKTDRLDVPFQLEGTLDIPLDFTPNHLEFTEMDIFLEAHKIEIDQPFEDLVVKYTLDGAEPSFNSPTYTSPIEIRKTTKIKAALFSKDGKMASQSVEKLYQKVIPNPAKAPKTSQPGLTFKYYEDNFLVLPDFDQLTPKKVGIAKNFDVESLSERIDHYAFLFEGYVDIPADGIYTFYVYSDDGSQLYIDGELVVDNNGSHSARTRKGAIALKKGKHAIRVEYFEDFLGQVLKLYYEGLDLERTEIPFNAFSHE